MFSACASHEEKLEQLKQKVNLISEELKSVKGEHLFYTDDKVRSRFTYYIVEDEIKFINEEMFTETEHSLNLYYFDDSNLIFLDGKSIDYQPKEKSYNKITSNLKIYFFNDIVLESDVIRNRQVVTLEDDVIKKIISHSKKMFELATDHLNKKEQNN